MKTAPMLVTAIMVGGGDPVACQELLSAGDVLEYARTDWVRPVFRIEAVESGVELGGRSGCHTVRTSFNPEAPARVRITCRAGDTLLVWRPDAERWNHDRPIGAWDSLEVASGSGHMRYSTGEATIDTISGMEVAVIPTTVVTVDSSGTVVRRLVERYAPGLDTATWGRFEVPDGDGWRVVQEFRLVAWRRASGSN